VIIPLASLPQVADLLQTHGWEGLRSDRTGVRRLADHSSNVWRPNGASMDIHWRAVKTARLDGPFGTGFAEGTEPVPDAHPLAETGLRRLEGELHLVALAAHSAQLSWEERPHLVGDLHRLLTRGRPLDGEVVLELARPELLGLRVRRALRLAAAYLVSPLPEALARLVDDPKSVLDPDAIVHEQRAQRAQRRVMVGGVGLRDRLSRQPAYWRLVSGGLPVRDRVGAATGKLLAVADRYRS
jgi:hypothetical protein